MLSRQTGTKTICALHSIIHIMKKSIMNKTATFYYSRAVFALGLILLVSSHSWAKSTGKAPANKPVQTISFGPYPPARFPVRIGIQNRVSTAYVASWLPSYLFVDGRPVYKLEANYVYSISNGSIQPRGGGPAYPLPLGSRCYITSPDYRIWAGNRWYRGAVELVNYGRSVTVINILDLEQYLRGVVPAEMPSSWNLEALKAQAVAARSYAWAHLGPGSKWFKSEGYDLVPDVRDQAYKGMAAEARSTDIAVAMTAGVVLKDSGRVKPGFYRATVGDAFENLNIRKKTVSSNDLEKLTAVPDIVGMTVKRWDAAGNAHTIQVMGSKKSREVYGIALAKILGLSTAGILDFDPQGNNWVITYRGPGNGARGLSQHGANSLANNGWKYHQILQQYYQDNDGRLSLDNVNYYYRPPIMPTAKTGLKTQKAIAAPAREKPPSQEISSQDQATGADPN